MVFLGKTLSKAMSTTKKREGWVEAKFQYLENKWVQLALAEHAN